MNQNAYQLRSVVSAPFDEVSYVAWVVGGREAIVVDPGFEPEAILEILRASDLTVAAILDTHGHADHIAGNGAIKTAFPDAPIVIGVNDARLLGDADANLSAPFGLRVTSPPADRLVHDGERIDLAGFSLLVREIPGHSPGSVVLIADRFDPPIVFGGDVLFAGSVGRTDFPGGSFETLFAGIREKLFILPDATVILPGHGPPTTVRAERTNNPFVGEHAGRYRLD